MKIQYKLKLLSSNLQEWLRTHIWFRVRYGVKIIFENRALIQYDNGFYVNKHSFIDYCDKKGLDCFEEMEKIHKERGIY